MFANYARYYQAFYADKPYAAEADYVLRSLFGRTTGTESLLELGSGAGGHALPMAKAGFTIHGCDMSPGMVAEANRAREALTPDVANRLRFVCSTAAALRLPRPVDGVLSLFHIASYHVDPGALAGFLETARHHLRPGGRFVFDYWHRAAVEALKPAPTVRHAMLGPLSLVRRARPEWLPEKRLVRVHYDLCVIDAEGREVEQIREVHPMRYYDPDELDTLLAAAGFVPEKHRAWMTGDSPSSRDWGACVVARAV